MSRKDVLFRRTNIKKGDKCHPLPFFIRSNTRTNLIIKLTRWVIEYLKVTPFHQSSPMLSNVTTVHLFSKKLKEIKMLSQTVLRLTLYLSKTCSRTALKQDQIGERVSNKNGMIICLHCVAWKENVWGDAQLLKHGYLKYRTEVFVLNNILEMNLTLL